MEIVINDDFINTKNISLKQGKNNIKILYHINPIFVIGICLKIKLPYKCGANNIEKIELQNKQQIKILNNINSYFSSMIVNYIPFIKHNTIFVKNNSSIDNIYININNIKLIHGKNYVNIFSL